MQHSGIVNRFKNLLPDSKMYHIQKESSIKGTTWLYLISVGTNLQSENVRKTYLKKMGVKRREKGEKNGIQTTLTAVTLDLMFCQKVLTS